MKGRIVLSSSPVDPEVKVRTEEPEKSWPGSYIKNFYFFSPHVQCKIKRNHTLLSLFRSALTCLPCRSTQASLHSFVAVDWDPGLQRMRNVGRVLIDSFSDQPHRFTAVPRGDS